MAEDDVDDPSDVGEADQAPSAPSTTPRKAPRWPWMIAVAVAAVSAWYFVSLGAWKKPPPEPKPPSNLHILGRDDAASKAREAELEARASASASATTAPSAPPVAPHIPPSGGR